MVRDLQNGFSTLEYPLLTWFLSGGLGWGVWGSDLASWVGSVGPVGCGFLLGIPARCRLVLLEKCVCVCL